MHRACHALRERVERLRSRRDGWRAARSKVWSPCASAGTPQTSWLPRPRTHADIERRWGDAQYRDGEHAGASQSVLSRYAAQPCSPRASVRPTVCRLCNQRRLILKSARTQPRQFQRISTHFRTEALRLPDQGSGPGYDSDLIWANWKPRVKCSPCGSGEQEFDGRWALLPRTGRPCTPAKLQIFSQGGVAPLSLLQPSRRRPSDHQRPQLRRLPTQRSAPGLARAPLPAQLAAEKCRSADFCPAGLRRRACVPRDFRAVGSGSGTRLVAAAVSPIWRYVAHQPSRRGLPPESRVDGWSVRSWARQTSLPGC